MPFSFAGRCFCCLCWEILCTGYVELDSLVAGGDGGESLLEGGLGRVGLEENEGVGSVLLAEDVCLCGRLEKRRGIGRLQCQANGMNKS